MATKTRVFDSSLFSLCFFAQRAELFKQRILKNFEAELVDKQRIKEARQKQDTAKDNNIEN